MPAISASTLVLPRPGREQSLSAAPPGATLARYKGTSRSSKSLSFIALIPSHLLPEVKRLAVDPDDHELRRRALRLALRRVERRVEAVAEHVTVKVTAHVLTRQRDFKHVSVVHVVDGPTFFSHCFS